MTYLVFFMIPTTNRMRLLAFDNLKEACDFSADIDKLKGSFTLVEVEYFNVLAF